MVYIDEKTTNVKIQKHTSGEYIELGIVLVNNLTHSRFYYLVENESVSGFFYKFQLPEDAKKLDTGEYTYYIYDGDTDLVIDEGLLVFGNYNAPNTSYNNDKKIIQYNG